MTCDTMDHTRAEYGPFNSRLEAENEARKLGLATFEDMNMRLETTRKFRTYE